jgi:phosphotransferase system IIB component
MFTDIIIYGIIFLVLSSSLGVTLYKVKTNKKQAQLPPPMPEEGLDMLIEALGGIHNISDVKLIHQRISIDIIDMKKIDQVSIKNLDIPAFLTGKTLKLLIKSQPEAVIKHIQTKRKED